jgi:hypothetical protein
MTQEHFDPPIQNLDAFDVLGERKDGGLDASIVAATPIDGSPETLRALTTKVRNYVAELTSQQFLAAYPGARGNTRVVIVAHGAIDMVAIGLIESLAKEARDAGIELSTERRVA